MMELELQPRPEPGPRPRPGPGPGTRPAYLAFEDFSHTPLGVETYQDGLQHPIELRRILTGDLSVEMSVSVRPRSEEAFRALDYQQAAMARKGVEIFDSLGRSVYSSFGLPQAWLEGEERARPPEDLSQSLMALMAAQHSGMALPARKPGRPPTAQGAFDPETGSVRYICRLHCGASLASAKGRRKHEKKHCPNFGKFAQPRLRGRGRGRGHLTHTTLGERRTYECRICGKVLRTYEGRRLHEKLQHVAKLNPEAGPVVPKVEEQTEGQTEGPAELRLRDSKQILMDHLKAAGLDPSILDSSNINAEEDEDFGQEAGMASNTNESFDNEDDEDDDDDDDDEEESNEAPASSSSGIEEQQSEHS